MNLQQANHISIIPEEEENSIQIENDSSEYVNMTLSEQIERPNSKLESARQQQKVQRRLRSASKGSKNKQAEGGERLTPATKKSKRKNPPRNKKNFEQMSEIPGQKNRRFSNVKSKVGSFRSGNSSQNSSIMSSKNKSRVKSGSKNRQNQMQRRSEPTLVMTSKLPGNGLFAYGGTRSSFRSNTSYTSRQESKLSKATKQTAAAKNLVKLPPMATNVSMNNTISEFGHTPSQFNSSSYNNMSTVTNLTRDVEERVENKLIKILEKKVKQLTKEVETEKAGKTQISIEYKKLKLDFEELAKFKKLADNHVLRERELKRVFEKEVGKLKEQRRSQELFIQNLQTRINDLDKNFNSEQQDKNFKINKYSDLQDTLSDQIKELTQTLEEKEEIIEDLQYRLQSKEEISEKNQLEAEQKVNELKNKRIDENEKKMYKITKLIGEVTDLSQKNAEIDFMKKKYIEKNKVLVSDNKNLMNIIDDLKNEVELAKKDSKSIRLAKRNNTRVLEKKIIDLGNALEKKQRVIGVLENEIEDLKEFRNEGGNGGDRFDNFEDMVDMPVKAKPTLFGDVDMMG